MQRLFTHNTFRNSRRCQSLLRYVVEHQLDGGNGGLKERTLGMEVFGRDADYDTNSDPVVRATASEIRKRIAQYYHEPGHESEIRIELPLGSYSPEFCPPPVLPAESDIELDIPVKSEPRGLAERGRQPVREQIRKVRYAILASILLALSGAVAWRMAKATPPTALDQFWSSIITSSAPVQLCVGTWPLRSADSTSSSSSSSGVPFAARLSANPLVEASTEPTIIAWPDLLASYKIIGFLGKHQKGYRVENAGAVTMNDLTHGPTVLVAAYDNPWTLRMTDPLRFHFMRGDHKSWIADRMNPSKHYSPGPGTVSGSVQDYAIVARLLNDTTGKYAVVAAGLGATGTIAASSFVTDPREMGILSKRLPKGWQSKSIEALISVQTVHGKSGASSIQAVEVW